MRHLIGLPDHYNRAAIVLGKALPKPILSEDPLAQLLYTLDTAGNNFLAEARDPLHRFVRASENLVASDFGPVASLAGTSLKDLWLPVLLLGNRWSVYVESLLGIPATSWKYLSHVQAVVLSPITRREKPKLSVRLYRELIGIRKELYKDFESNIKNPYELRTAYDRQKERVEFLDEASRVIDAGADDAERFLNGDYPAWLTLLLKWDAVERIDIACQREQGTNIRNQIASIVAIPECPPGISSSPLEASVFLDDCFTWLGLPGTRSSIPPSVFVLLTSAGEEWYHLLDVYCERNKKFYCEDCGLEQISGLRSDESNTILNSLLLLLIERRLGLPADSDLRPENEFSTIPLLFDFGLETGKGNLKPRFAVSPKSNILELLEQRIGCISFLIALANTLIAKCDCLLNVTHYFAASVDNTEGQGPANDKVTSDDTNISSSDREKSQSPSFWDVQDKLIALLGASNSSKVASEGILNQARTTDVAVLESAKTLEILSLLTTSLFRVQLSAFARDLDIAVETMSMLASRTGYFPKGKDFHSLEIADKDDDLFRSVRHLLHLTINGGSPDQRSLALAAVLYVLDPDDVVPGEGSNGISDDEYCTASTLLQLEEGGVQIPEEISEWAFNCKANIDRRLNSEKQRQVHKLLESYLALFNSNASKNIETD